MISSAESAAEQVTVIPLHAEDITIERRTVATGTVRVSTTTTVNDRIVDETLTGTRVDVTHVPIGRFVEDWPAIRIEGDTTIMPVVDEVLVRRLLLREEVHVRCTSTTEHHTETVQLRAQHAVVTRTETATNHQETLP